MKGVSTIIATIFMVVMTIGLVSVAYMYMANLIPVNNGHCTNETIERPCCLNYMKEKTCYDGSTYIKFDVWKNYCVDVPHFENITRERCA
jgi:hypothetical protein